MKLVNELIKSEKHTFTIPVQGKVEFAVKRDDKIKLNDILFKREYKKVLDSFNICEEFSIDSESISHYLTRINGEYVIQGEILAERVAKGGLSVKKIIATYDGIVSYERIDKGYIDILSEHISEDIESKIIGKVLDVDYNSGIQISSNAFVYKTFIPSKFNQTGIFEVLKEGESMYSTRDLSNDYSGKIVYVGRFAFSPLVNEIMRRGAVAVVTWAMDYSDYEEVIEKIVILGGFGQISYEDFVRKYIASMDNSFVEIKENNLYWSDLGQTIYKDSNNELLRSEIRINDKVRIIDEKNFGKMGKVIDTSGQTGVFVIKLETSERVLLSEDTLEVIE